MPIIDLLKGTSNSFWQVGLAGPLLKRSASELQVRLPDDSAFANLSLASAVFNNGANTLTLTANTLTADRNILLQNGNGTLAFLTDISGGGSNWDATGTVLKPLATGDTVQFSAGTAALPGISFVAFPDDGLYSVSDGIIGIGLNGLLKYQFKPAEFNVHSNASNFLRVLPLSGTSVRFATSTAGAQEFYFGSAGADFTIEGEPAVGTNIAGADLIASPAPGTGNSTVGGNIEFQVPNAAGSGSTVQTLARGMILTRDRVLRIGTTSIYAEIFSTATNTVNLKCQSVAANTFIFGNAANDATLKGVSNTGTDAAGSDLFLATGAGTGNSTVGGNIEFQVPNAAGSGSTVQTLARGMILTRDRVLRIGTTGEYLSITSNSQTEFAIRGNSASAQTMQISAPGVVFTQEIPDNSGTNQASGGIVWSTGIGTGNSSLNGDFVWQTSNVGASGTSLQALTTKMTLFKEGELRLLSSGLVTLPALAIGNETDTGFFAGSANTLAVAIAGIRHFQFQQSGGTDIVKFGGPGGAAVQPQDTLFWATGWEAVSSSNNQSGPGMTFRLGPGTGSALSGDFLFAGYTEIASGTTLQSTVRTVMTLKTGARPELIVGGTSTFLRNGRVSIGVTGSGSYGTLDGPCLVLGDVAAEPSTGVASTGVLFVNGNNLKFMDSAGTITTIV